MDIFKIEAASTEQQQLSRRGERDKLPAISHVPLVDGLDRLIDVGLTLTVFSNGGFSILNQERDSRIAMARL